MLIYKPESLELLRQRIDLADVVSSHVEMHRAGASYKGLCPFHEEKTPSFVIQKGDRHYHCFGCGAHGDAIAFLMSHLKLSFIEAVENLAERFQVSLEKMQGTEEKKGPNKIQLRQALDKACHFYHEYLLHSEEGVAPLQYLSKRGIDLEFIKKFEVGFAPQEGNVLHVYLLKQGFSEEILEQAGLVSGTRRKDFFNDRITFPIRDAVGAVIGFSARKIKEETFGGKYINTPETPLFKKSHILFGLSYCRQRIAKERKALIVEGQIDALRLIHSGFNFTVAGQGTAFGEGHVKELLNLGVNHIYLALDADNAGKEAAFKVGNLFQKKAVNVSVITLPDGADPDSFIREKGADAFSKLLTEGVDYLAFLVSYFSTKVNLNSPSGKNEMVQTIAKLIRSWEQPLMVFESLRRLAALTNVPEALLGIKGTTSSYVKRRENIAFGDIDPDRILETDLLRWLFLAGETYPRLVEIVKANLSEKHFCIPICQRLFSLYMQAFKENKPRDFFSIAIATNFVEDQEFFSEILQKKFNLQRAEAGVVSTVKGLLDRLWMAEREAIKEKIQNSMSSEDELIALVKEFDTLKKQAPEVAIPK